MSLLRSTTLSIAIAASSPKVYDFVSEAANLPQWAKTFIRSIKKVNSTWLAQTPQGEVTMRLAEKNSHGILDHYVKPPSGDEVYVPMRVVPNGAGSEVLFTIFQQPGMPDENYKNDIALVQQDLANLKKVMEQ